MKTLIYFFATSTISWFLAIGAEFSNRPGDMIGLILAAFAVWGLFLWHCNGVMKKKQEKRQHDAMIDALLRQRLRR